MAECRRVALCVLCLLLLLTCTSGRNIVTNKRRNKYSVGHVNICGLRSKFDLLSLFVKENGFDVFGVTETFLNETTPTELVDIPGYVFERRDRPKAAGGGIGVYIKEDTEYVRRHELENDEIELICLEFISTHKKPYFLCFLYRPPHSSKHLSKNFINIFRDLLSKMALENKETIIMGDINCNYFEDNTIDKPLKELLSLYGFNQLVETPTRITDTSETLIDLILTTKGENLCNIKVLPSSLSDHDVICFTRKTKKIKNPSETIKCRDYSNYDYRKLRNDMQQETFNTVYAEENPNTAWKNLKQILLLHFNKHSPFLNKKVKGIKSPWITREIKTEMNKRDKLQRKFRKSRSTNDFDEYKKQRNKVNVTVRKAKCQFNKDLLQETAHDPSRFWKALKKVLPVNSKSKITKTFLIDGILTSNAKQIAIGFCSFFTDIARKLKLKVAPLKNFIWKTPKPIYPKTYSTFHFKQVQVNQVFKHLKKLSRKKATGPDDLPPGMLKDVAVSIAKPLCYVINQSLKTSVIPEDFKYGVVTPVFKAGNKQDLNNYRPITVLPACSKIFERCIHAQLSEFLEEMKLLSPTQFGFRKQRNTELAATLFLDKLRENMDNGRMTGSIFVDLSKAFDTLGHSQIIASLASYGVTGSEKELFINYLFDRKQSVRIGNEISSPQNVTCGVPQGSILGPLLFLVTFNDIGSVLKHSEIITYADDTVIYVCDTSVQRIQEKLQEDFTALTDWLESTDLIINLKKGKTECMLFGTSQKIKNSQIEIACQGNQLATTTSYRYLGVNLDQTLNLTAHVDKVYKKASGRLNLLRRIRPNLTKKAALTIYKTMLLPIFTYCSIITASYTRTVEQKIANFEQRAYTIIYSTGKSPSKANKIREVQRKRLCIQVFNCVNGNVCNNFKNYFKRMDNQTRNKNCLLRLPKIKLEGTKRSFKFIGAKTFNDLPLEVRKAPTLKSFICLYDKMF